MVDAALKDELILTHDEFRRLHEEHQACERRLDELHNQSFPSESDEQEQKQMKRRKLHLKDRMEQILREVRVTV